MVFIILAGFPAIKTSSGKLLVTIAPVPITTLLPISTPGQITALPPIQTLFPIVMGLANSRPLFL